MNNQNLAAKVREIRDDMYREHGAQFMADALGIALRTWMNYESGVVMPAKIVLKLIVAANVNPGWLLSGRGQKYGR
jgi:hypothetical protein